MTFAEKQNVKGQGKADLDRVDTEGFHAVHVVDLDAMNKFCRQYALRCEVLRGH